MESLLHVSQFFFVVETGILWNVFDLVFCIVQCTVFTSIAHDVIDDEVLLSKSLHGQKQGSASVNSRIHFESIDDPNDRKMLLIGCNFSLVWWEVSLLQMLQFFFVLESGICQAFSVLFLHSMQGKWSVKLERLRRLNSWGRFLCNRSFYFVSDAILRFDKFTLEIAAWL